MSGWSDLGTLLGGGFNTEDAYETGRLRTAQTENALESARSHQLDNMGKEFKAKNQAGFEEALMATGQYTAEEARMIATTSNAGLGSELADTTRAMGYKQHQDFLAQAASPEASLGDQVLALQGASGNFIDRTANEGGAMWDRTAPFGSQVLSTPEAQSRIAENQAQTQAALDPKLHAGAADSLLDPWHGKYGKPTAGQMANPNFDESQPPSIENPAFIAQPGGTLDPEAYHPGDSRSAMYRDRIVRGAESAVATIHNLTLVPIDASKGWGMPDKGGILNTAKGNLMQNLSSDAVQQYRTMLSGLRQNLAFIEGSGLLPTGLAQSAYDALDFQEGDSLTGMTRLHKMAEYRQTIESGLMPLTYSNQVAPAVKERMKVLLAQLRKDVPFTHEDLLTLQYSKSPLQTIGDTIKQKGFGEPVRDQGNPARQGALPVTGAPATGIGEGGWMDVGGGRRIRVKPGQ